MEIRVCVSVPHANPSHAPPFPRPRSLSGRERRASFYALPLTAALASKTTPGSADPRKGGRCPKHRALTLQKLWATLICARAPHPPPQKKPRTTVVKPCCSTPAPAPPPQKPLRANTRPAFRCVFLTPSFKTGAKFCLRFLDGREGPDSSRTSARAPSLACGGVRAPGLGLSRSKPLQPSPRPVYSQVRASDFNGISSQHSLEGRKLGKISVDETDIQKERTD